MLCKACNNTYVMDLAARPASLNPLDSIINTPKDDGAHSPSISNFSASETPDHIT